MAPRKKKRKKSVRKTTRKKTSTRKSKKVSLEDLKSDLEEIKERLTRIESEELRDLEGDEDIQEKEIQQLAELTKLEDIEKEIQQNTAPHPLAKITYRDFTKGIIGAFFGIVGHFAFFYGGKIAHDISIGRANALMLTSLVILILFIYFSGFREIRKAYKSIYVPWRVLVIYLTAHLVITFVLLLFGQITFNMEISEIYKNIATVSILAVMGAATADLIGGE